jgi:hypothetical protein
MDWNTFRPREGGEEKGKRERERERLAALSSMTYNYLQVLVKPLSD